MPGPSVKGAYGCYVNCDLDCLIEVPVDDVEEYGVFAARCQGIQAGHFRLGCDPSHPEGLGVGWYTGCLDSEELWPMML